MLSLLVDADIVAFKQCAINQNTYDWGDGDVSISADLKETIESTDEYLENLKDKLDADQLLICLSDDLENWRNTVFPDYKMNRQGSTRPELLYEIKDHLFENYTSYRKPLLEADDVMGILSTHPKLIKGDKIIVSEDKDMKTIPGLLYNPNKPDEGVVEISPLEADYWWLHQTITGDATDGYKGCPGAGAKAAESCLQNLLDRVLTVGESWEEVIKLYESKGFDEELALMNARVARICRHTDYDFKRGEVNPWTP